MSRRSYDRHTVIFSPEGRLFQVEYAYKAAKSQALTGVGWINDDCAVLVSQKKVESKLQDPASFSNLFKISKYIGMLIMGYQSDCRTIVFQARKFASEFFYQNGYEIPVSFLAKKIANHMQFYTQHAYRRVYGCECLLIGNDDQAGPTLLTVQPSGFWSPCRAYSIGQKQQEAKNHLEKALKEAQPTTTEDVLEGSLICLMDVVGSDCKSGDLEAFVVGTETGLIETLTEEQIEERLNAIADKD